MEKMTSHRIAWIDSMRGFCMLAIFWFHSEMYFIGFDKTPYGLYVGTALAAFFFISGYVFRYKSEPISKQFYKTFRALVVPYFFFCTPIALVKPFVHGTDLQFCDVVTDLLTGHASWFIAALIVARLISILLMRFWHNKHSLLGVFAVIFLLLAGIVGNRESLFCYQEDLWCVNEGMLGCSFMLLGHLYRHRVEGNLSKNFLLPTAAILTLMTKFLILHFDIQAVVGPICTTCYPLFVADLFVSVLLLVSLFGILPNTKYIMWIGSHSLVFYFCAGGCPLIASRLMTSIGLTHDMNSLLIFPVFVAATLAAAAITFLCYRYLSFILKY